MASSKRSANPLIWGPGGRFSAGEYTLALVAIARRIALARSRPNPDPGPYQSVVCRKAEFDDQNEDEALHAIDEGVLKDV
jgi:hypothetical protein